MIEAIYAIIVNSLQKVRNRVNTTLPVYTKNVWTVEKAHHSATKYTSFQLRSTIWHFWQSLLKVVNQHLKKTTIDPIQYTVNSETQSTF